MSENYLSIHGHFYQPPRENPWLESIEIQESARPYHDWNEKIHAECYLPNARARVVNDKGEIVDISNNYENISFNFGPTLFSWLEKFHYDTYQEILKADRLSVQKHRGHGAAIAQAYNHMIMPLANRRDQETQVEWGLADFRSRFRRDPEAMWLPETACNEETLEILANAGMKYCILAPHQAEAVRPLHGGDWIDVSGGQIDPKHPYRFVLKSGKSIDLFFYDGPISKAMGFGDLLFESRLFMQRLEHAVDKHRKGVQMIHVATDGETYGHHKAFGERVIAYLTRVEAPKKHFKITNYGEFLELNPPAYEVRIKGGEGTSWSCEHGVKRWKEHCGCRGGGPEAWTQHWRKPLRASFDWLRDELAQLFESQGRIYLKDVWQARLHYINVILDRSEKSITAFFREHAARELTDSEKTNCLKLLESQRHSMLMYTSCGWFFTEVSGIETLQVLEYAARALQLAEEASGKNLQPEFLSKLASVKGNLPELGDGRKIFEKLVSAKVFCLPDIAAFYAMISLLDERREPRGQEKFHVYDLDVISRRKESFGDLTLNFGAVRVISKTTLEKEVYAFCAVHVGLYDVRCSVRRMVELPDLDNIEKHFFDELHSLHIVEIFRKIDDVFGEKYYSLKDLPVEDRMKLIKQLTREGIVRISGSLEQLFEDSRRLNEIYRSINLPIPEQIRYAAEHTLRRRMKNAIGALAEKGFSPQHAQPVNRIIETARSFDVELKKDGVIYFLSRELEKRVRSLSLAANRNIILECINIQKLAKKMKIELEKGRSQEHIFYFLNQLHDHPEKISKDIRELWPDLLQLAADLNIQTDKFKKTVQPVG